MPRKITPSTKQRLVAKDIAEQLKTGKPKTLGETLVKVGKYAESSVAHQTATLMSSKGMQKALQDEGISVQMADDVVKNIMLSPTVYEMVTPDNQLRAADMIYKRLGSYAEKAGGTTNVVVFNFHESLRPSAEDWELPSKV